MAENTLAKTKTNNGSTLRVVPEYANSVSSRIPKDSFAKPRDRLASRAMHKANHENGDDLLDQNIAKATSVAGGIVKDSMGATQNVIASFFNKIKQVYGELNSNKPGSSKSIQKIISGILSIGFLVSALKSTVGFITNLFSKNSRSNGLLKFVDAGIKWIMGLAIFRTFTNAKKGFKFNNLNQILLGMGLSFGVSQLTGMNEGKRNLLRTLSKFSGAESTLEKVSGYTPLPDFSQSMQGINPRGS